MRVAFRWIVLSLLFAAGSAAGHTRSQSHSVWEINGTSVDLVMTIPTLETDRIGDGAAHHFHLGFALGHYIGHIMVQVM